MKQIEISGEGSQRGYWNKETQAFEFMFSFQAGSITFAFDDDELSTQLIAAKSYAEKNSLGPASIKVRETGSQQYINYFEKEDVDGFLDANLEDDFLIYLRTPTMAMLICDDGLRNAKFPEEEYPQAGSYTQINRGDLKEEYEAAASKYQYDPIAKDVIKLCIFPLNPE